MHARPTASGSHAPRQGSGLMLAASKCPPRWSVSCCNWAGYSCTGRNRRPAFRGAAAYLPDAVLSEIEKYNCSWSDFAASEVLQGPDQRWQVLLVGVTAYAPLAWQPVADVLQRVTADVVAIDQPPTSQPDQGPSFDAPGWIQACRDCVGPEGEDMLYSTHTDGASCLQLSARLAGLAALQLPAAVGKDILDPFEVHGLHSTSGYVTSTSQIAEIAQLLGYVPGAEYVAAMSWAQEHGAQLSCIDAPLKLQEKWVTRLADDFDISYSILASQLDKELQALEALLPREYRVWDWQFSNSIQQQQEPGRVVAAYKASKAIAAAMCSPGAMQQQVLPGLSKLLPLKFRHFAKKEAFMASRLAELCRAPLREGQRKATIVAVVGRQHVHPIISLWRSTRFWSLETERIEVGKVQTEDASDSSSGSSNSGGSSSSSSSSSAGQMQQEDLAAALQEALTGHDK